MQAVDQIWCVQIFRVTDPDLAERLVTELSERLGDAVTAMSTGGRRDSSVAVETTADAAVIVAVQEICAEMDPASELIHLSTADPWHRDEDPQSTAA